MTKRAVRQHRERQARKGLVRIEVQVPKGDADRVRALAKRLRDPATSDEARSVLEHFDERPHDAMSLKALLRNAPELDLPARRDDRLRDVEL
ncbi:MAG: hypothetical protein AAF658_04180 [Myxococcota bacterium]